MKCFFKCDRKSRQLTRRGDEVGASRTKVEDEGVTGMERCVRLFSVVEEWEERRQTEDFAGLYRSIQDLKALEKKTVKFTQDRKRKTAFSGESKERDERQGTPGAANRGYRVVFLYTLKTPIGSGSKEENTV